MIRNTLTMLAIVATLFLSAFTLAASAYAVTGFYLAPSHHGRPSSRDGTSRPSMPTDARAPFSSEVRS